MTSNQRRLLNYLWTFLQQNDQLPPNQTISEHFGWVSSNSAYEQCLSLSRHELLERNVLNKWKFTAKGREMMADGLLEYGETVRRSYPGGPLDADMRLTRV